MTVTDNKTKHNNGVVLINYSDERYTRAQKKNTKSALKVGGFRKVISFGPEDLDDNFRYSNESILRYRRGGGYWLWKPYIIHKALMMMSEGELLFYCDSGSEFVNSIDSLLSSCGSNFNIVPFEIQTIEKHWTKRDCFVLMDLDCESIRNSKQICSGFSLWQKSDFTINFVKEWMTYSQDERIVTDMPNVLGQSNYEGFVEHRHDQSIFSLLIKKYKIQVYRDPAQHGNLERSLYPASAYPQLLLSTRQMNTTLFEFIKKKLRPFLPAAFRAFYNKKLKYSRKVI